MKNLIIKKSNGQKIEREEFFYFVKGFLDGTIPEYQASSFLTSMNIIDLDEEETKDLTEAMLKSGTIWDLSKIGHTVLDKHSTGGVGDKVTIVLCPLVASAGGIIGKTSAKALGYCGGTINKLEGIPGIRLDLSYDEYIKEIKELGMCLMNTTHDISPADGKILPLRDVISAFGSTGLLVSSVMSKKLATNSDCIVIELMCGEGAFCKTLDKAKIVSKQMLAIGKALNKDIRCVITNMNQPLGYAIGNFLELKEAMEALKGNGPKDLMEVVLELGSIMLVQGKIAKTKQEAENLLLEKLNNGEAYKKFQEWIKYQGGDLSFIENYSNLCQCKKIIKINSTEEGYIQNIYPSIIGTVSMDLGAGVKDLDDGIDYSSGIILNKKVGDYCKKDELLCTLYTNKNEDVVKKAIEDVKKAYEIVKQEVKLEPTIYEKDIV